MFHIFRITLLLTEICRSIDSNLESTSKRIKQEEGRVKELYLNIKNLVANMEETLSKTKQIEVHSEKCELSADALFDELVR